MNDSEPKAGLDADLARQKTSDLAARIGRANDRTDASKAAQRMRRKEASGHNRGFRLASDFLSAIFVGVILGLALDTLFGTQPIFMIVLMLFGFAAGVRNVVKSASEMNAVMEQDLGADASGNDEASSTGKKPSE